VDDGFNAGTDEDQQQRGTMTPTVLHPIDREAGQQRRSSIYRCPQCGSFFDAPRENPLTGQWARKCAACNEWYPVASSPSGGGKVA
jgi:hypothetical protein